MSCDKLDKISIIYDSFSQSSSESTPSASSTAAPSASAAAATAGGGAGASGGPQVKLSDLQNILSGMNSECFVVTNGCFSRVCTSRSLM